MSSLDEATPAGGQPGSDLDAGATAAATVELLAGSALFRDLPRQQLSLLIQWFHERSFTSDDLIIRQGDYGQGLYLLVEGYAEVIVHAEIISAADDEGAAAIPTHIALLGPGEPFGEMSLLDDEPIVASVRAASRVRCLYLPKTEFLRTTTAHPAVGTALIHLLVRRLRDADYRLAAAAVDPLTGLSNRLGLEQQCRREGARLARSGGSLSVMFADINGFKQINDTYGHPVGDQALRVVADALRRSLRSSDYVARYGGDEFVALLPDADLHDAQRLADRIQQDLASRAEAPVTPSVSIGVQDLHATPAARSETGDNQRMGQALDIATVSVHERLADLLASADKAMYASKARHREAAAHRTRRPATPDDPPQEG